MKISADRNPTISLCCFLLSIRIGARLGRVNATEFHSESGGKNYGLDAFKTEKFRRRHEKVLEGTEAAAAALSAGAEPSRSFSATPSLLK